MTKQQRVPQTQEIDQQVAVPGAAAALQMPDASSTAAVVLAQAMDYCARKMRLSGPSSAVQAIKQGKPYARNYCNYSVAKQVAEALGHLDDNVKAVYVCELDATPEDVCFGEGVQGSPIHMIIWSTRKTSALQALVSGLDRALSEQYSSLLGDTVRVHLLDAQVVDDADVQARLGYGALIASIHNPPLRVWHRDED